ncbi:MAG: DNA polymerase III subunit gamma/tau [Bacteroidales bacterium]
MEKQFIVSARKYRPDSFDLVVGQPSVTRTLKNAITSGKLAHAYLFTGPRGVGKTTCARIFAKTINCTNLTPESEACNECDACKTFRDSRSFNIHELDAASNNSVDDIKNLIEQVRVPPQTGRYSVYIIDEVHMLSLAAFNAFLKTLEEPPAHAIFILATTEKHKILPTILSRCQVYDFHRIQVRDIIHQLQKIAGQEGIVAEEAALNIIAQKADGAMRDALSIFDMVVSFCGKEIAYQQVIEHLNVLDYDYYFKLTALFLKGDYRQAFLIYDEILEKGFDAGNFVGGLASHFRNLLVSRDPETLELLETGTEIANRYRAAAESCSVPFLYESLKTLSSCELNLRQAKDPRLHVELALLSLCRIIRSDEPAAKPSPEPTRQNSVHEPEAPRLATPPPAPPASNGVGGITRINEFLTRKTAAAEQPKTPQETPQQQEAAKSLTTESLQKYWLKFAERIKEDQPRLYNTLTTQLPVLEEDTKVKINLNNPLQEKAIRSIQAELKAFLSESSGQKEIEIITFVPDQPAGKKLYTAEEKYTYLQKKNPELDLFRQSLDLELE